MSESEKSKPAKESGSTSTTSASSESSSSSTTSKVSSTSNSTPTTSTATSSAVTSSNSSANVIPKLPSKLLPINPPLPPPPPPPPKLLPPPAPVTRPPTRHHPPITEAVIKKAFLDFVKDPECLDKAAHYLYESLLDDAVMGVYLEVHNSIKTGSAEAIEGESEDDTAFKIVDTPNYDVFGMSTARKAMDCNCPNCDRLVAASRFATHLENCMGMGRKTSRVASRRVANAKEGNSSYFYANPSDDDDDTDRSSEKRRKKIQSSRTNGSKKNGKSS